MIVFSYSRVSWPRLAFASGPAVVIEDCSIIHITRGINICRSTAGVPASPAVGAVKTSQVMLPGPKSPSSSGIAVSWAVFGRAVTMIGLLLLLVRAGGAAHRRAVTGGKR